MANYLWLWTGLITGCTVITILLFRDKPRTPPSKSASVQRGKLCPSLALLFKNCNFIIMLVAYSLIYGVYTIFGACVSFFTNHYGFNTVGYVFALDFIYIESNWQLSPRFYSVWTPWEYILQLSSHQNKEIQTYLYNMLCAN